MTGTRQIMARSAALLLLSNFAFGASAARSLALPSPLSRILPNGRVNNNKNASKRTQVISSAASVASFTRGGTIVIDPPPPSVVQRGGGGKAADASDEKKGASMAASTFNLVNNVAGAGILTLAAGKASGTGWIPAVVIVASLGWAASTTFRMIAKACDLTGENDFKVRTSSYY